MAARLHPNDRQRLIRAWEVLAATGRSLAAWQSGGQSGGAGGEPLEGRRFWLICQPPRAELYAACDARFLRMLRDGALDEVRALKALGLAPSLPVMKALGVPELSAHLSGALSLDEATARAQQATRNYAKRQETWLRTQLPSAERTSGMQIAQHSESLLDDIFSKIRRFVLTG